jgi:hypothetical protein
VLSFVPEIAGGNLPSSAAAASFKSKFPYFVKVLKGWQKVVSKPA